MIASPLTVEVRRGAVAGLGRLLASGGISSTGGRVAVLVGPGQGERLAQALAPQLLDCDLFPVTDASVDAARDLSSRLRESSYDAVVGIGGGRTLDVAKYTAGLVGLPMVAVATNLAHDGIASPVASLSYGGRKASHGVPVPLAVFVDLDYVATAPPRSLRSGIGDVVNNLSALADWQLAADARGETIDGLAAAMARGSADAVLHHPGTVADEEFLTTLADALILSGMAMTVAGSSRPCSGGDHEILYAVDELHPDIGNHGELAGIGALFCTFLRADDAGLAALDDCLRRHGLPRVPVDLGLTDDQFAAAVAYAPQTRPDRYTILEQLGLDDAGARRCTAEFVDRLG